MQTVHKFTKKTACVAVAVAGVAEHKSFTGFFHFS
jgi:hypothetical protein